ncbi:MAG: DNA mismatch endonuclease Vsr [Caldilineaceae bacterium]|nr:DNA mismatch endonuclease Vsr [Caldilineaceae bacterium]
MHKIMDVHSPGQRSYNMSKIKGKNTKPEMLVRKWLWANGYRYRLHYRNLPGKPDIVFPGRKKVIFIHGCFWHKHECQYFKWPKSNAEFWQKKIEGNAHRDQTNFTSLVASDWAYLVIWECVLKGVRKVDLPTTLKQIGCLAEIFLAPNNKHCMEIDTEGLYEINILSEVSGE